MLQINQHLFIDQSKLLGKGSTGNVYLGGSYRDPNLKLAVKAIDLSEVNNEVTQYLLSCQIVALSQLAKLNVQHIVKLHQIAFQQGFCYLAMQLLEGGSLAQYIRQNPNGFNEKEVEQLFRQLLEGYKAIRNLGIVHRDIKPDNIIFRHTQNLNQSGSSKKLCFIDFGYCTKQSVPNRPQVYYNVGSPKYMAPEAYKKNTYSEKSDLWALGIILYQMLHGRTIDKDMDMDEYMNFMENNQIPIQRNLSPFLSNLIHGLLAFDANKRISCDSIDQMLNANIQSKPQVQSKPQAQSKHQVQDHQFSSFIPQFDIAAQNRKDSPFYRSEIIIHRSDPSETIVNFHSHHHPHNQFFDPRRQQRNFSQENDLHEFNHTPKKIIHLENTPQNINPTNLQFSADKRQIVQRFRHFEQRNYSKQFINSNTGPVIRHLQKIQEEYENEANRQHLMRINNTAQNFRVEPDMKRSFLRAIDPRSVQPRVEILHNLSLTNNPNVQFFSNSNFTVNPGTSSKPQDLVRSQIFHINNDRKFNSGTNFYSSQINQNTQRNFKVVTSDKKINHSSFDHSQGELLGKNLNKSYSTNNVTQKIQIPADNMPVLMNSHFTPLPYHNNFGQINSQSIEAASNQKARPIDILIQNKQIANNRAFLRNTMPSVFQSSIDPINHSSNHQIINQQNVQTSNDPRNKDAFVIEKVNHSNFKQHGSYFDQNFVTPQKQNLDNNIHASDFKPLPFSAFQTRNEKSNSFKHIPHEAVHSIQRDRTMINLLNHTPPVVNQPIQFNQPMIEGNQQANMNLTRPQPMQMYGQNVQINQGQQLMKMGQVQGRNVFFGNSQQKNIIHQNQPLSLPNQIINLQQPIRNSQIQFRRSTIINMSEHTNQIPVQINQQRGPIQNQNLSLQEPRQTIISDKRFYSQVSQPQRQILVNKINQNPEINRMIRLTYPFGNQQPIPVTQF